MKATQSVECFISCPRRHQCCPCGRNDLAPLCLHGTGGRVNRLAAATFPIRSVHRKSRAPCRSNDSFSFGERLLRQVRCSRWSSTKTSAGSKTSSPNEHVSICDPNALALDRLLQLLPTPLFLARGEDMVRSSSELHFLY